MGLELDVGVLAVIVLAMSLGSIIKGMIGTGLPMIAIPVLAGFLGVERAVVIMAIPTVVTNTWLLWEHRSFATKTRNLPTLIVAGTIGVTLGVLGLAALEERMLAIILVSVIAVYVAIFLSRPDFVLPKSVSRILSAPVGLFAGALQGATGISGPVVTTYAHSLRLEPRAFLFTLTAQIQVFAVAQVLGLAVLGLYDTARLAESLLALVPIAIGLPIGIRLSYRVQRRHFEWLVLVVVVLMGVKLIFDALGS